MLWGEDKDYEYCTRCHEKFSTYLVWKHHCRACGQICCHSCSSHSVLIGDIDILMDHPPSSINYQKEQRVCISCYSRIKYHSQPYMTRNHSSSRATTTTTTAQKLSSTSVCMELNSFLTKYTMGQKLGEGSFAIVNRGLCNEDRSKVAVKVFSRAGLQPEDEAAVTEEISILKGLRHPNIVRMLDFYEDPSYFYMVMEYLDGGEVLDNIVNRATYNEADVRQIARSILHAISYLHATNIVHRDLKPDNLMLASTVTTPAAATTAITTTTAEEINRSSSSTTRSSTGGLASNMSGLINNPNLLSLSPLMMSTTGSGSGVLGLTGGDPAAVEANVGVPGTGASYASMMTASSASSSATTASPPGSAFFSLPTTPGSSGNSRRESTSAQTSHMSGRNSNFVVKVVDFGFATQVDDCNLLDICGTPEYIAPEILYGQAYGKAVDMWSFGILLFMFIAGSCPFVDRNQKALFRKITKCYYEFNPTYWTLVSPEVKDLIKRLLTLNPLDRITVEEVLAHPWMQISEQELSKHHLNINLLALKKYHRKRQQRMAARKAAEQPGVQPPKMKKLTPVRATSRADSHSHSNTASFSSTSTTGGLSPYTPTAAAAAAASSSAARAGGNSSSSSSSRNTNGSRTYSTGGSNVQATKSVDRGAEAGATGGGHYYAGSSSSSSNVGEGSRNATGSAPDSIPPNFTSKSTGHFTPTTAIGAPLPVSGGGGGTIGGSGSGSIPSGPNIRSALKSGDLMRKNAVAALATDSVDDTPCSSRASSSCGSMLSSHASTDSGFGDLTEHLVAEQLAADQIAAENAKMNALNSGKK